MSLNLANVPAPFSTSTVKPFFVRVAATAGVQATRASFAHDSFGTPKKLVNIYNFMYTVLKLDNRPSYNFLTDS